MGGIFMRRLVGRLLICFSVTAVCWTYALIKDKQVLQEELIRFHVIANSDKEADQAVKLQVRDAVLASICSDLEKLSDVKAAKAYLSENLPKIQTIANRTLKRAGFDDQAVVSLCKEAFDTRHYDTFSLPAGIYESLKIVIGNGEGHNWWCVAFPGLCMPATSTEFAETAVSAGFSPEITNMLCGVHGYELRFFLLDALGKWETIKWQQ